MSLLPVYLLHSAIPFYAAYSVVAGYSLQSLTEYRHVVLRLLKTRSVTQTLSTELLKAIEEELTLRDFYERKAVEWLGPDLRKLSTEIAVKLKPDVTAAAFNMAVTLLLAFTAFRVFAIPALEYKALSAQPPALTQALRQGLIGPSRTQP